MASLVAVLFGLSLQTGAASASTSTVAHADAGPRTQLVVQVNGIGELAGGTGPQLRRLTSRFRRSFTKPSPPGGVVAPGPMFQLAHYCEAFSLESERCFRLIRGEDGTGHVQTAPTSPNGVEGSRTGPGSGTRSRHATATERTSTRFRGSPVAPQVRSELPRSR